MSTKSPTAISFHLVFIIVPLALLTTSASVVFTRLSALCRLTSSNISLIAETIIMTANGTAVVNRPVGETLGICCISAMKRKNKFAYRRNCSKINLGKKLSGLYFAVVILLSRNPRCMPVTITIRLAGGTLVPERGRPLFRLEPKQQGNLRLLRASLVMLTSTPLALGSSLFRRCISMVGDMEL